MRKVILTNYLSPGDILMLTAAVRDLHLSQRGMFQTDVRTSCSALWDNNPYLTKLEDNEPGVERIHCEYPLIHQSNQLPYHFIHAFRLFLQEKLGVEIRPQAFKGDVHLRDEERGWLSQVDEITGRLGSRFWIIVSGGKTDFTAKWWDPVRAQAVVDHFQGRIQFVQCGAKEHVHPRLEGVIDLVGKTDLRQMMRLMYHADGVVCPVTMYMHLAAAVETKPGRAKNRPCVVIAGGREPSHWEAYQHHAYLHTMGCLPCCDDGGCWKSRVVPRGDGDWEKDGSLCRLPVTTSTGTILPRCLDMISARQVIEAIERYLEYEAASAQIHEIKGGVGFDMSGAGSGYSAGVQDHFYQPRNTGTLPDADVVGKAGAPPGQGNFMTLYLRFDEDKKAIVSARFQTYGCPSAIACGSWVSEWLPEKTVDEAQSLTAQGVMAGLGGLPIGREHCAELAVNALQNALQSVRVNELEEMR